MVRNRTAPEPAARPGSDSTAAPAARMKILRHDATTLTVQWGRPSRFHAIWLRDNCRCAVCGDPAIGRRALRLTALDLAVRFERVEPVAVDGADGIAVTWSDGHHGRFDSRWLQDHAYDAAARRRRAYIPRLWDDDFRRTPTAARYADVVDDDAALLDLLHTVKQHGLAFLEGAPARRRHAGNPGAADWLPAGKQLWPHSGYRRRPRATQHRQRRRCAQTAYR